MTTKSEIRAWFGEPADKTISDGAETWTYREDRAVNPTSYLLGKLFGFGSFGFWQPSVSAEYGTYEELEVFFSSGGSVRTYNYRERKEKGVTAQ